MNPTGQSVSSNPLLTGSEAASVAKNKLSVDDASSSAGGDSNLLNKKGFSDVLERQKNVGGVVSSQQSQPVKQPLAVIDAAATTTISIDNPRGISPELKPFSAHSDGNLLPVEGSVLPLLATDSEGGALNTASTAIENQSLTAAVVSSDHHRAAAKGISLQENQLDDTGSLATLGSTDTKSDLDLPAPVSTSALSSVLTAQQVTAANNSDVDSAKLGVDGSKVELNTELLDTEKGVTSAQAMEGESLTSNTSLNQETSTQQSVQSQAQVQLSLNQQQSQPSSVTQGHISAETEAAISPPMSSSVNTVKQSKDLTANLAGTTASTQSGFSPSPADDAQSLTHLAPRMSYAQTAFEGIHNSSGGSRNNFNLNGDTLTVDQLKAGGSNGLIGAEAMTLSSLLSSKPILPEAVAGGLTAESSPMSTLVSATTELPSAYRSSLPTSFQTAVPVEVGKPGWSDTVMQRVMWMSSQQIHKAEIALDPPELGPMQVRITTQGDQTTVAFTSNHALVREALDQGLPRLREMMTEQGLDLADADVSDQRNSQQGRRTDDAEDQSDGRNGFDSGDPTAEELSNEPVQVTGIQNLALVDHYV